MKPNFYLVLATALLLFTTAGSAVAQEKYDFATVSYLVLNQKLRVVSTTGIEEEKTIEGLKVANDYNPLLKKVNDLQEKGWELFDRQETPNVMMTFVLRKKKK